MTTYPRDTRLASDTQDHIALFQQLKQALESAGVGTFNELLPPQTAEAEARSSNIHPKPASHEIRKTFFRTGRA
jgi:hypothetical protein